MSLTQQSREAAIGTPLGENVLLLRSMSGSEQLGRPFEYTVNLLSEDELIEMVDAAIAASGATGMQAMGPVMGQLKPQLQGRADMGAVSQLVKSRLTG